ncbi:mediator of RNA polymerase II transcription subunit 14 [Tanacetum coccineum]
MGLEENFESKGKSQDSYFHRIGDGSDTSVWFDIWSNMCSLSDFIPNRAIYNAGLNLNAKSLIRFVMVNGDGQVSLIQYSQQLASTLLSHETCFTQAVDSMFCMHEGLQQARARIYDVLSAIEILLTGMYERLPKCTEDVGEFKVLLPLVIGDTLQCGEYCILRMAAFDTPFTTLYTILHEFCVPLIMDTIIRQIQALRIGRWKGAIRFELISYGYQGQAGGDVLHTGLNEPGSEDNKLELPRLALVKIKLEDKPSSITWEEKHQPDGPGSEYLVSYLSSDQSFAEGDSDPLVCSDDIRSPEIIATVKLELNSLNFPDMYAKETHSCLLKSHFKNVTSSALDCSSLGKATLDTSNTSLVDKSTCGSYLGGSADTPNQGDGSRIVSDDTKSLKALATIKLELNRWIVSLQSAEVDDRLNYDLNSVMDAWNEQPPIPDPHGNVADSVCRNVAKADEKSIYKESTLVGSEISPVVLKSLTSKIEKSESDECKPSCNYISKLLSPDMYSAPHVAVNKVFDNVVVPSTLTLKVHQSGSTFDEDDNADIKRAINCFRTISSAFTLFSREIDVDQLQWYGYCLFKPLASLRKQRYFDSRVFKKKNSLLLFIGYCSSEHYSSKTSFTSRNCPSREGMEGKSFEEGLAEITETLKRLQSTLLFHQTKMKESFRQARQDFSLARRDISLATEKLHRSIKAAIKEEVDHEEQFDFLEVQLNQRIPNRTVKARKVKARLFCSMRDHAE